jgi:magnesium transporter
MQMFIYFSQLIDKEVIDINGKLVGNLYDITVNYAGIYPQSSGLIVRKGFPNRKYALIKWSDVELLDENGIRVKVDLSSVNFTEVHDNKQELALRRDILDQQVVDTYNHKVIRVNDIHLLSVEHSLVIAHVDIGLRGIMRRLGVERLTDFLVRTFKKDSAYLKEDHLIPCKYIQPLNINPASMTIKIDVPQKQISSIPAADLGEIFLELTQKQQVALFKSLDLNSRVKTFVSIDFKNQKSITEELSKAEVAELLNTLPSDDATDFLEKLSKGQAEEFLGGMESVRSKKLSQLLGYSSDSAGGLMTADYIAFTKGTRVDAVIKQIKERFFKVEPIQFVYILDENNRFVGATSFRRLILADLADPIEKTAFPKTYFVHLDSSLKEVAYLMEKYKYNAIAVVDDNNVIQGIITVDDILSQLIAIAWRRLKRIKTRPVQ